VPRIYAVAPVAFALTMLPSALAGAQVQVQMQVQIHLLQKHSMIKLLTICIKIIQTQKLK
jgi:hypothetical protein